MKTIKYTILVALIGIIFNACSSQNASPSNQTGSEQAPKNRIIEINSPAVETGNAERNINNQ